jgi:hypothetical protein
MKTEIMDKMHFVKGLDPVADAFSGTVYSDVVSLANYDSCCFVVYAGVGTTGTSTFTVSACDNTTPSTRTAIPFMYREITSGDTEGTITAATTSGFTCTAGSSKIILISVDAGTVAAANSGAGNQFCELKAVESVDSPVLGGIMVVMGDARYKGGVKPTAIA